LHSYKIAMKKWHWVVGNWPWLCELNQASKPTQIEQPISNHLLKIGLHKQPKRSSGFGGLTQRLYLLHFGAPISRIHVVSLVCGPLAPFYALMSQRKEGPR
jgi:hypothetical protein